MKINLEEIQLLIVTNIMTEKSTWKKFFTGIGVKLQNIHQVDNFELASELLSEKEIQIVVTTHEIAEESFFSLLKDYNKYCPNRAVHSFFVVTDNKSSAFLARINEHNVDALIQKPYSMADFGKVIEDTLYSKSNYTSELKAYYKIKEKILNNDFENAEKMANQFQASAPNRVLPLEIQGLLAYYKKNYSLTQEHWHNALEIDPRNLQISRKLFDLYIEMKNFCKAFEISEIIKETPPINPERIPNLIRVSLASKNYQNLYQFCKIVLEEEILDQKLKKPIAAALVLSSKHLIQLNTRNDIAKEASLKALELANRNSSIYSTALMNLKNLGEDKLVKSILSDIPSNEMHEELRLLELKLLVEKDEAATETFVKAQLLYNDKYKSAEFYDIFLKAATANKKNRAFIEDVIFEACKYYPSEANKYKSYLNS